MDEREYVKISDSLTIKLNINLSEGTMKHFNRIIAAIFALAAMFAILSSAACAPSQSAASAITPEPTATATAMPTTTPSPTPMPTPEPSPAPRVIEFSIERTLTERASGGEIAFHQLTYTKNQDMVLTFTVSNPSDYYFYLVFPIYANINGYGLLFTKEDKFDTYLRSAPGTEVEVSLSVKLDEIIDSLMNIEQIRNVQFDCSFVIEGETFRGISDEFINADCPADYVQSYNMQGDKANILINPEYYTTGISNDIQICSIYGEEQKKVYLTIAGTAFDGNTILGEVADFGLAYLAIDFVVNPYDENAYSDNGEEIYLPNSGYSVISFDVSRIPDFDYQKHNLSCSFEMTYSHNFNPHSYFSAILRAENDGIGSDYKDYDSEGEIWLDNTNIKFIYQGIEFDDGGNFYFDGTLINKSESKTIAYMVDIEVKEMGVRFLSNPVPPNCALQMHSIRNLPNDSALHGADIQATITIFETGGIVLGKTKKTIRLADE
jgi:hypothetical protein